MKLCVSPITLREARAYVAQVHRNHKPPQGGLFAIAAARVWASQIDPTVGYEEKIVGVAIVGRPVARMLDDDYTAEVTRVATDGTRNACSILYGAAWRAARAMGYRRLVTYTLPEEGGVSLLASGAKLIGEAGGGRWSRKDRPRVDEHPTQQKFRWEWKETA